MRLIVFACVGGIWLLGQNGGVPDDKFMQWQAYSGNHALAGPWALHVDVGWREMSSSPWQQWLVRPGVNYNISDRTQLSLTYSFFKTHPAGVTLDALSSSEHRMHQQIRTQRRVGKLRFRHRFRAEQRYFGPNFENQGLQPVWMQHRFRYLAGIRVPLGREDGSCRSCYLRFYDEAMIRARNSGVSHFEQNRIYGGLGFRPKPEWNIESGVFYQNFKPLVGGPLEHNLVVSTTVSTSMPFRKLFGK